MIVDSEDEMLIISPINYFFRITQIFKPFFHYIFKTLLLSFIFFHLFFFWGRTWEVVEGEWGMILFLVDLWFLLILSQPCMFVWLSFLFISVKHANDSGSPNAAVTKGELNASVFSLWTETPPAEVKWELLKKHTRKASRLWWDGFEQCREHSWLIL